MNAKKILPIALSAILAFGCQKDSIADFDLNQKKTTNNNWAAATNQANPYEYLNIGLYHNNCLNYFKAARSGYTTETEWIESRYQITLDFFCSSNDTVYCNDDVDLTELKEIDSIAVNDSLFDLELNDLPNFTRDRIHELLNFFSLYDMTEYLAYKQAIVSYEDSIVSDSTLSEDDRRMLLIATQVARYSGLYWKQQIEQNFPGWNLSSYQDVEWAETTHIDVRGAVIGYKNGVSSNNSISMSTKGSPAASSSGVTKPKGESD